MILTCSTISTQIRSCTLIDVDTLSVPSSAVSAWARATSSTPVRVGASRQGIAATVCSSAFVNVRTPRLSRTRETCHNNHLIGTQQKTATAKRQKFLPEGQPEQIRVARTLVQFVLVPQPPLLVAHTSG